MTVDTYTYNSLIAIIEENQPEGWELIIEQEKGSALYQLVNRIAHLTEACEQKRIEAFGARDAVRKKLLPSSFDSLYYGEGLNSTDRLILRQTEVLARVAVDQTFAAHLAKLFSEMDTANAEYSEAEAVLIQARKDNNIEIEQGGGSAFFQAQINERSRALRKIANPEGL